MLLCGTGERGCEEGSGQRVRGAGQSAAHPDPGLSSNTGSTSHGKLGYTTQGLSSNPDPDSKPDLTLILKPDQNTRIRRFGYKSGHLKSFNSLDYIIELEIISITC